MAKKLPPTDTCQTFIKQLEAFIDDEANAVQEYGAMAERATDPIERLFWLQTQSDEGKHLRGLITLKEEIMRRCAK